MCLLIEILIFLSIPKSVQGDVMVGFGYRFDFLPRPNANCERGLCRLFICESNTATSLQVPPEQRFERHFYVFASKAQLALSLVQRLQRNIILAVRLTAIQ
jgi:hypothetical protein